MRKYDEIWIASAPREVDNTPAQSEAAALSFPLGRFLCKTSTQTSVQEVIAGTVQTDKWQQAAI